MTNWTGRPPLSYSQTQYDSHVLYDAHILYSGVAITSTNWTGRTIHTWTSVTWTVLPIQTWFWDDTQIWTDSTYYWHDSGNIAGATNWTWRIIP